jgi:hypothetical protein
MNPEHYGKEADRLLNDDVLAHAFTEVRMRALADLAIVDADDKTQILRLQAKAGILSDVLDELKAAIIAMGGMDGGVSASNERTE